MKLTALVVALALTISPVEAQQVQFEVASQEGVAAPAPEGVFGLPTTARLAVCQPGEWIDPNVTGFPWATIQCDSYGQNVMPNGQRKVHQRPGVTFNSAECQPWLIVIFTDSTASIYCAPR